MKVSKGWCIACAESPVVVGGMRTVLSVAWRGVAWREWCSKYVPGGTVNALPPARCLVCMLFAC